MSETQETSAPAASGDIVARAGRYYRNTRYLIATILVLYGAWSIYDGFIAWPRGNARAVELRAERAEAEKAGRQERVTEISKELEGITEHNHASVLLNQVLGVALPPLGIFMLFWALRSSRGEIRLTPDDVLHVPGHPPVPIDAMTALDRRLWDRKGIAYVEYEAGANKGRIRLDDFIYERKPIDAIYDRILSKLDPEAAAAAREAEQKKQAESESASGSA